MQLQFTIRLHNLFNYNIFKSTLRYLEFGRSGEDTLGHGHPALARAPGSSSHTGWITMIALPPQHHGSGPWCRWPPWVCPRRCHGVAGHGLSPRRTCLWWRCWSAVGLGAPFSGGTGVEGSAVDPETGGAVEDVGTPPPLLWSHEARPVPEEDASMATVAWMARRCAVLRRDGHGSIGGESWARRRRGGWGRLRTMWPTAAWWNPSSYGMSFI
jgi:hypothetical protein